MRKRFLATVEVFADKQWLEDNARWEGDDETGTVWTYVDDLLPSSDDGVGTNVVKVRRVAR